MTLEQLRVFLEVARRQHVTRAARALNLTQSAVSASLAALEARHGVQLFDRTGRGIALTPEGRAFLPEAQAVLDRAEAARTLLADLGREPRGRLRIHASQTVASHWLPARLVMLAERHPLVSTELRVANTRQVADAVAGGAADLGLVEGEIAHQALTRQVVARDRLVLVMAPDHPLGALAQAGAGAPVTPACPAPDQLAAHPWILREPGSGTRAEFEAWLAARGMGTGGLRIALELPSNEAVLGALAHSRCLGALSHRAVAAAIAAGQVRALALPGAERAFWVLTDPARHRTRAVAALLGLLGAGPQGG